MLFLDFITHDENFFKKLSEVDENCVRKNPRVLWEKDYAKFKFKILYSENGQGNGR